MLGYFSVLVMIGVGLVISYVVALVVRARQETTASASGSRWRGMSV